VPAALVTELEDRRVVPFDPVDQTAELVERSAESCRRLQRRRLVLLRLVVLLRRVLFFFALPVLITFDRFASAGYFRLMARLTFAFSLELTFDFFSRARALRACGRSWIGNFFFAGSANDFFGIRRRVLLFRVATAKC